MTTAQATGLLKRRQETREAMHRECAYQLGSSGSQYTTIVQPLGPLRNQLSKPSCVGQSVAACVNALDHRAEGKFVSALDLWVDARRMQNDLDGVEHGTRAEYAIWSLCKRGWSAGAPQENQRPASEDARIPSLTHELDAYDHRYTGAKHYALASGLARTVGVINALQRGYGVVFGTGVRTGYGAPPRDEVLGIDYLSGDENGHEQRIFAFDEKRGAFGVQNSWGGQWGGCTINGVFYPGCVLVSPTVIQAAWDIDIVECPRG